MNIFDALAKGKGRVCLSNNKEEYVSYHKSGVFVWNTIGKYLFHVSNQMLLQSQSWIPAKRLNTKKIKGIQKNENTNTRRT